MAAFGRYSSAVSHELNNTWRLFHHLCQSRTFLWQVLSSVRGVSGGRRSDVGIYHTEEGFTRASALLSFSLQPQSSSPISRNNEVQESKSNILWLRRLGQISICSFYSDNPAPALLTLNGASTTPQIGPQRPLRRPLLHSKDANISRSSIPSPRLPHVRHSPA